MVNTKTLRLHPFTPGWRFIRIVIALCAPISFVSAQAAPQQLSAAEISSLPLQVSDQGPHHRSVFATDRDGNVVTKYTELMTGGWRQLEDGTWTECDNEVELFNGGAIARKTRYQVIFSPTSDDPQGVFDVLTTDKKRLRGQCIGLAYTSNDGASVFIAEMKDVAGFVSGKHEVIYPECFDGGGIKADLRYRVELASFHQDVILRSKLPPPSDFGLPNDSTLEIWTQFLDAPDANVTQFAARTKGGVDTTDYLVSFGEMRLGLGNAFPLDPADNGASLNLNRRLPVQKAYEKIQGMQFLIEAVPYVDVAPGLSNLPDPLQARIDRNRANRALASKNQKGRAKPASLAIRSESEPGGSDALHRVPLRSLAEQLKPGPRKSKDNRKDRALAMSRMNKGKTKGAIDRGYVLDYDLYDGTLSSLTCLSDVTYCVKGNVYVSGACVIEGGTVVKFEKTNPGIGKYCQIVVDTTGSLSVQTDQYRPATFCAVDDGSIGAAIGGGSLSGTYANIALAYLPTTPITIRNIHVRDAGWGVYFYNPSHTTATLTHSQFMRCSEAVVGNTATVRMRNVLIYNSTTAIHETGCTISGEHVTLDAITYFLNGSSAVAFTNSLFVNVSTYFPSSMSGDHNGTNASASDVFLTASEGKHYLKPASSYRNAGTTAIDPQLASDLKSRTTIAPVVLGPINFANDVLTFFPQAQRDTDLPDLGYHYDPLDWIVMYVYTTGVQVKIMPGSVIGTCVSAGLYNGLPSCGLGLGANSSLIAEGTAENPIRFVRFDMVQERAVGTYGGSYLAAIFDLGGSPPAAASIKFVSWSYPVALDPSLSGGSTNPVTVCNSEFHGGALSAGSFALTNCLFERTSSALGSAYTKVRNSTFFGGSIDFQNAGATVSVSDTLFDKTGFLNTTTSIVHNYNGYQTNYSRLPTGGGGGANDIILTSAMTYTNGTYGRYYQTITNLLDRGSTSATNVGLYHFTTRVPEIKEFGTTVDIGYHYVAAEPSTQGLVGYWRLDEGTGTFTADSSGNGDNGALLNNPTWMSGQVGPGALSFDGINDYVTATESSALRLPGDMTLAFWMRKNAEASDWTRIVGKGSFTQRNYGLWYDPNSKKLVWDQHDSGGGYHYLFSSIMPSTGSWYHVGAVVSGTNVLLYINGGLDASGSRANPAITTSDPVTFGYEGVVAYFPGSLDDIRVYNRALSAAEIATLAAKSTWDADGDGVPDYLEDANGNGVLDSGETNPLSATDSGFQVLITQPDRRFSIP